MFILLSQVSVEKAVRGAKPATPVSVSMDEAYVLQMYVAMLILHALLQHLLSDLQLPLHHALLLLTIILLLQHLLSVLHQRLLNHLHHNLHHALLQDLLNHLLHGLHHTLLPAQPPPVPVQV